jgi:hypothetical protein
LHAADVAEPGEALPEIAAVCGWARSQKVVNGCVARTVTGVPVFALVVVTQV